MEEKRKRGRPRKIDVEKRQQEEFAAKNNLEIDKADYDFYDSNNEVLSSKSPFNPLADKPVERDYSKPKIENIQGEISEPTFHRPPQSNQQGSPQSGSGNPVFGDGAKNSTSVSGNPINDIDPAEKKAACEQMVDAALDVYETLWGVGGKFAQISDERIQGLVNEGKISPNQKIPVEGGRVSVFEFINGYNEQVAEAVKVDQGFKKKVRPAMVRVFMKNGWGLSDEQYLGIAFGKDIIVRGMACWQLNKGVNAILNSLTEEKSANNLNGNKNTYASGSTYTPPPPPPPSEPPIETFKPKPTPPSSTPPIVEDFVPIEDAQDGFFDGEFNDDVDQTYNEPNTTKGGEFVSEKMNIVFEDNPLRNQIKREPPPAVVSEEIFIPGGEIQDKETKIE